MIRRVSNSQNKDLNVWPSMVDAMSSTALILFFIMTIVAAVASNNNSTLIAENREMIEEVQEIIDKREAMYDDIVQKLNDGMGIPDLVKRNGTKIYVTADILFNVNEYTLSAEGKELAEQMGRVFFTLIKEQMTTVSNPDSLVIQIQNIEIIGHADIQGDDKWSNRALSFNRAGTFAEAMLKTEADVESRYLYGKYIKPSGMSMYEPMPDVGGTVFSQTPEQMDKNRRIEFIINFSSNDFDYILEKYAE